MPRRLPPLNALRAFEAAARLLSFTRAADELAVTQAAVSHQIKALEEWIGVPLFRRVNRGLLLTDAGQALLSVLRDALDRIAAATERLRAGPRTGQLVVSALPSFAAKWLVPRLPRFQAAHPNIELHLHAAVALVDFTRDPVDLALRFGAGRWAGVEAIRLLDEEVTPVCSPALLAGGHPLREPADLRHYTLLHDDFELDWQTWLDAAGVSGVDASRGPRFTGSDHLVQAALAGHGIALGRGALVADDLAAGRLVRPFALSLPSEWAYYIVYPAGAGNRPKIAAFRDWILGEATHGTRPSVA